MTTAAEGEAPPILAVGVAKGSDDLAGEARRLALGALRRLGIDDVACSAADVEVDGGWIGEGYAVPTEAGDAGVMDAARRGAWVLDRTYTGKAFAALLDAAHRGRFGPDDAVVFWHTGGHPAVFAPGGAPAHPAPERRPLA